ncbi:MAG: hypothetical protein V2I33_24625 [Kangiellaceae bacterium]|jgi:hypothetical protein|nr:hypothetical protein [Kangiellaceae bacterium]
MEFHSGDDLSVGSVLTVKIADGTTGTKVMPAGAATGISNVKMLAKEKDPAATKDVGVFKLLVSPGEATTMNCIPMSEGTSK